ncbi:MAG: hypothetical protein ACFFB8_16900 [Promethearchaeota archaeon]
MRAKRTQTWLLRETRLKTSSIKENSIEELIEDTITTYHTTSRGG